LYVRVLLLLGLSLVYSGHSQAQQPVLASLTKPVIRTTLVRTNKPLDANTVVNGYDYLTLELYDSLSINEPYGPEYQFLGVEVVVKLGLGAGTRVKSFTASSVGRNAVLGIPLVEVVGEECKGAGKVYISIDHVEEIDQAGVRRRLKLPEKMRNFVCTLNCG
jgi:hypothetical protein